MPARRTCILHTRLKDNKQTVMQGMASSLLKTPDLPCRSAISSTGCAHFAHHSRPCARLARFAGLRASTPCIRASARLFSARRSATVGRRAAAIVCAQPRKVAVLGAAGGIGQPLALLLKMQPYITELALYDIANVKGVAADISHCNTSVQVPSGASV